MPKPLSTTEPLPDVLTKNGFTYKKVSRESGVAIYAQYKGRRRLAFEVFVVRSQKESEMVMGGTTIKLKAKELFPSNESFGKTAYSVGNMERAEVRKNQLLESLNSN